MELPDFINRQHRLQGLAAAMQSKRLDAFEATLRTIAKQNREILELLRKERSASILRAEGKSMPVDRASRPQVTEFRDDEQKR